MIRAAIALSVTLGVVLAGALVSADVSTIFLPPDADVVTIVGKGFKLQIDQLDFIQKQWKEVADETAEVETPRDLDDEQKPVLNTNLFQQTLQEKGPKDYGTLSSELLSWIDDRATQLADKIDRLSSETLSTKEESSKVVAGVLLFNTIVDLENLTKEDIKDIQWIKLKLKRLSAPIADKTKDIEMFVAQKIENNKKLEAQMKGSNTPPRAWIINTMALRRILHEQRFSQTIGDRIVDFLRGDLRMMQRLRLFDLAKKDKLSDGLSYAPARGKIPADFPFSAQEAIVNGA